MADAERRRDAPERRVPEDTAGLPAPWVDPWLLLRRDLVAVLASTRLRLRELARLNREGELPLPPFWPTSLASWFWPLGLALALALAAVVLLVGMHWSPAVPDRPVSAPVASEPLAPAPSPAPVLPTPIPSPPPPPQPPDPLIEQLESGITRGLIRSVVPQPARARLELALTSGFAELPPAEQQRQADVWFERSRALGYDSLELVDGNRRALARSALVGSGMILLTPPPAP